MMGQRCEFPGCKNIAAAPVKFANGATNYFCRSCLDWLNGRNTPNADYTKALKEFRHFAGCNRPNGAN